MINKIYLIFTNFSKYMDYIIFYYLLFEMKKGKGIDFLFTPLYIFEQKICHRSKILPS